MIRLRRLVAELHRRSVWSVLVVYTGAAWLAYEVILSLVEGLELPPSLPALTIVLFLIGLPVVLATAIVQQGGPRLGPDPDPAEDRPRAGDLSTPARLFTWRNALGGGVAGLALWGLVAMGLMVTGTAPSGAFAGLDDPSRRAVAVLPFTNMAADEERYFADGVHEDVLTQMAFISDLAVTSRTGVQRFRDTELPVRDIAAQLGVDYIVEGSVRREGDRVRIVAQLIDAETDTHLWAETYDRDLADVFALQSEVAAAIARALEARLSPAERDRVARAPTSSAEAYDLYLQARELGHGDRESVERGIELTRAALDLDPGFGPAWANLASLYGQRVQVAGMDPAWADSGVVAARHAVDRAPERPEGYKELALNLMLLGRPDEARRHLLRAIELNPSYADAMQNLGVAEFRAGRHHEAVLWLERGRRITPGSGWILMALAHVYAELGLWDAMDRVLAEAPPSSPETLLVRAASLHYSLMRGEPGSAFRRARELVERAPYHPWVLTEATIAAQAAGQADDALEWAERLYEVAPRFRYVDSGKTAGLLLAGVLDDTEGDPARVAGLLTVEEARAQAELLLPGASQGPALSLAEVQARRGEHDAAIASLEEAYDRGYRGTRWLEVDAGFAALRAAPGFQRLLDRMTADLTRSRERLGR